MQVAIPHDLITIPVREQPTEVYQESLLYLPWVSGEQDARIKLRGNGFKERFCIMDNNSITMWGSRKAWDSKDYSKQKVVVFFRDVQFFTPSYTEDGSNNSRRHTRAVPRHSGAKWFYFGFETTQKHGHPSTSFMFSTKSTLVYVNWITFIARCVKGERATFPNTIDNTNHWDAMCQADDVFGAYATRFPFNPPQEGSNVGGKYLPEDSPYHVKEDKLLELQYLEANNRHNTTLLADYELQEKLVQMIHPKRDPLSDTQPQRVETTSEADLIEELNNLFSPPSEDTVPVPQTPDLVAVEAATSAVESTSSSTSILNELTSALGLDHSELETSPTSPAVSKFASAIKSLQATKTASKPPSSTDTNKLTAIVKQLISKQKIVSTLKSSLSSPTEADDSKVRWKKLRQKLRFATDQEKKFQELEKTIDSPNTTPDKVTNAITDLKDEINKEQENRIKDLEEKLQSATIQLASAGAPDVDLVNSVADIKKQIVDEKEIQTENTELADIVIRERLNQTPIVARQLLDLQSKVQKSDSDLIKNKLLELAGKVKTRSADKKQQQKTLKDLVDAASTKMITQFESKEEKIISSLEEKLKSATERIIKLESHQSSDVSPSVKWTGLESEQIFKNQLQELQRLRKELSLYRSPEYASASAEVVRLNQQCRSLESELQSAKQGIPQVDAQALTKLKASLQKEKNSYKLREDILTRQMEAFKKSKDTQISSVKHEVGSMRRSMQDLQQGLAAKLKSPAHPSNAFEDSTEVDSISELLPENEYIDREAGVVASVPDNMNSLLCLKLYSNYSSQDAIKYHSNLWSDGQSLHQLSSFDDPLPLQSESGALYPTINRTWRFQGPENSASQIILSLLVIPPPQPQYPMLLGDFSERFVCLLFFFFFFFF